MNQTQTLSFLLIAVLCFCGCIQEDFRKIKTPDWSPKVAVPLVNASYSLENLLAQISDQGLISTNSQDVILVSYQGEVFELKGEDLIDLRDIPFQFENDSLLISLIDGSLLKKLQLKTGQLLYEFEVFSKEAVTVILRLPNAIGPNGEIFEKVIQLPWLGDSLLQNSGSFDLAGYTLSFPTDSFLNNLIKIEHEAFITRNGEKLNLEFLKGSLKNLAYSYLEGYFGYQELGFPVQTFDMGIFGPWRRGTLFLDDPKISIFFHNSIGLPIQGTISNVSFEQGQEIFQLIGTVFQDNIAIGFPGLDSADFVDSTRLTIDRTNSNIRNGISISPEKLTFAMELFTDAEPDFSQLNFAFDTSRLSVSLDVELPLALRMEQIRLSDTFALEGIQFDEIDFLDILLLSENGLPFGLKFQGYFLDQDFQVLDSVFDAESEILSPGQIDNRGIVVQPSPHSAEIQIDKEKLTAIGQTRFLSFFAEVNSSETPLKTVHITTQDRLSLSISAKAGINP